MRTLNNPRHERFAQLVAEGRTQADAYRDAFPLSRKWKDSAIHPKASHLSDKVGTRVRELQEELAKRSVIQKEEVVKFLSDVVRTPIGEVGPDSPLAQAYESGKGGVRVSFVSKLAAIEQLAKLLGWYAPQKVEQEVRFAPDEAVAARIGEELARVREGRKVSLTRMVG